MNTDHRPDPDGLLDWINHDRSSSTRGRLKVFFGASAGVGKTYAMLQEARRRLDEGTDVLIGIVETHGRRETAELVDGLPNLPLRPVAHRGVTLYEFDLDAALVRKPALILIDELAHTNAPGSHHPKRWQDVEDLLSRGIDVYTTLNVQHLESINDTVARLTGIPVRETVPDGIFDACDEIALIDIPSDDLLQRLHEGKIYVGEGANKRAAESFFKKSNLVALRELALRRTAERVDAESDMLTAAQGRKDVRLGQKILVCVGHDELSTRVIRHAKRMAAAAKARWCAVYVETARHERLSDKALLIIDRNLRLAEKMGAGIVRITGSNAADEILSYARENGFTRIVLGHRRGSRAWNPFRGTLYADLIEHGAGVEVTTVTKDAVLESDNDDPGHRQWLQCFGKATDHRAAVGILAIATLIGLPFRGIVDPNNLTMIYLTAVVIIAARLGTAPSMLSSFLSVAAFNFFYTEPIYTFSVIDPGYYYTFAVMLMTGLIVGSLASKLALQARQLRKRAAETDALYALTRELSAVRGARNMADVAVKHVREAFKADAAVLMLENEQPVLIPSDSPAADFKETGIARRVLNDGRIAGRGTDTLPGARGLYVPLLAEDETFGVLGLLPYSDEHHFTAGDIGRLETFAGLIASAFCRARRAEEAETAKVESASEKLRNVLLSSVSHDLRTPLASITGAADSALMLQDRLPGEVNDLLTSIRTQAARLAKLVTNLLDATSLESGTVRLNKQPYFIQEVIGSALSRIADSKGGRTITASAADDLPLIDMDGLMIEQVLVNLLDNAVRYTKDDGHIAVTAQRDTDTLRITVADDGTGIRPGDEVRIFDKFYTRSHAADGNAGLGLAICRGIVTAHGGSIFAQNGAKSGAVFTFTLPGGAVTLPAS